MQVYKLPHNWRLFLNIHIIVLQKSKLPFRNKTGARFFPLLLHIILDLHNSYKLGLTGWLERFIFALYHCNSRYQGKHSQI